MPGGLLNIKYRFTGGKEKTYHLAVKETIGGSSTQPIDQAFHENVYGPRILAGDFAATSPASALANPSVAETMLRFLRGMEPGGVTLTGMYLSDGKTPGPQTGPFSVIPLQLPCDWSLNLTGAPVNSEVAPGNQTAMVVKQPALFGERSGHLWLRYVLKAEWLAPGTEDDTTFQDPTTYAAWVDKFNQAVITTGLATSFQGRSTTRGIMFLGQAHFYTKAEVLANPTADLKGVLKYVTTVRAWQVKDAQARQTTRGRKRPITPQQAAAALAKVGVTVDQEELAAVVTAGQPQLTGARPALENAPDDAWAIANYNDANGLGETLPL